jgi:hypothetical protein
MSHILAFLLMFQSMPDISGQWRLSKDKSDFGGLKAPTAAVRSVELQDRKLIVHTVQNANGKSVTTDSTYFINGPETKNFLDDRNAYAKAAWTGSSLEIVTNMQASNGDPIVIEDSWEVSKDIRILTIRVKVITLKGESQMKLVWIREK